MSACRLFGSKDTSAISDVLGTGSAPRNLGGVSLVKDFDLLAIDFETAIDFLDCTVKAT